MYARAGAGPPADDDVLRERRAPSGIASSCGTPTRPTAPPGRAHAERRQHRLVEADALQHRVGAEPAGQLPDALDRLLAALLDDLVAPNSRPSAVRVAVAAEQDHPLGAEPLGGDHAAEPDRAVADHGHRLARPDPRRDAPRGGRSPSRRSASAATGSARRPRPPGRTTSVPSACGTRTASPWPPSTPGSPYRPPCRHEVCSPSRQKTQVPSDQRKGATTKSPCLERAHLAAGFDSRRR